MKKVKLKTLIKALKEVKKKGGKYVQYEGTLFIKEMGNEIILTTEMQW
ncbi:hypothetical protein Belba_0877 [Belliella baltica DSM 15883]|uniref:Uncharacterized protein n=1 Tax=Belliella baltica (strain DSM 15883 / CIP 108006 / LMG 21964 / BA134) TaxID=866536 RepID=I3Z2Q6_BELBD|nr:hypothetical protein [Belliella baltica]AFL83524.1 hypothetical protein Belba_0877 [Belliella baltica DSM 15883]